MRLSIIIPNYNGQKSLVACIKSIYDSSSINSLNYEIIVADDTSTDDSVASVEKNFPTVKVFRLKEHGGASAARNRGIREASGDYLLFIDSDAWFNKSTIETLNRSIEKDFDIYFPKIIYEDGKLLYPVLEVEKQYPHISGCFVIRKESLKRLDENFDEHYETYLEDYDFFMRSGLAGLRAKYVEDARVVHANKTGSKDYSRRYYLEMRNTFYGIEKLGKLAKKSGLYNPFTFSAIAKAFFCGILNFAWFNWYGYSRSLNFFEKVKVAFRNKNRIFLRYSFQAPFVFIKCLAEFMRERKSILKKKKNIENFYR